MKSISLVNTVINLFYHNKVANWVSDNFAHNREGDVTNHTQHYAIGNFDINNIKDKSQLVLIFKIALIISVIMLIPPVMLLC